jgi:sec-independent protein translocase protein TatA
VIGDILQPTHLIFLLLVALLVLGPKRLPEAGRAMGKGIRSFRGAVDGIQEEASSLLHDDESVNEPVAESDVVEQPATDSEDAVTDAEPEPVAVAPATVIEPTVVSATSRADD